LTESIVARSAKNIIHYIVLGTRVLGTADVPILMSQKLALQRETTGIAYLVDACVESIRVAKSSNLGAPDRVSSSEAVSV
jgi:hypothetical protein